MRPSQKPRTASFFHADGTQETRTLDRKLPLADYQALVGGFIEVVRVRHDGEVCDMVVNEDGLGLGLPYNSQATELLESYWTEQYGPPENRLPQGTVAHVVGDVVILHGCRV